MAETENEPTEETKPEEETTESKEEKESRSLTQEEINRLIESARKQEKDKLYGTIDDLKEKLGLLTEAQKKDQDEKEKVKKEAEAKADEERQKKMSAEDRMAEQFKRFEERLATEASEREKLQTELESEREKAELERYKTEVLKSAGDDLVRELVQGNSKDEIDASVVQAKDTYQQYFDASVKKAEGDPGRKLKENVTGKMPSPADPDPDPMDEESLKGLIPKIDPYQSGDGKVSEDYKKNREEILSKVANIYKNV